MSQSDTDAMEAAAQEFVEVTYKVFRETQVGYKGCLEHGYKTGWRSHAERTEKLVQALEFYEKGVQMHGEISGTVAWSALREFRGDK